MFSKTAKIINVDLASPGDDIIKQAVKTLSSGKLLVYPTDTAYGIGIDAFNERAVRKLYEVKSRKKSKPTHVIVRDWNMISGITKTNKLALVLFEKFMPEALTMILPRHEVVPNILTAGLDTLGVRIPDSRITTLLSKYFPKPYTTPSANKEGGNAPYSVEQVEKELGLENVDLVLDAGPLPNKQTSTIVDLSNEESIKIIREGGVKATEIMAVIRGFYARKKTGYSL